MMRVMKDILTKFEELANRPVPSAELLNQRLNDSKAMSRYIVTLDDFRVDFSRQSLTDDILDSLISWGESITPCRDAMLNGEIVNRSENRPALHTWLRDPESELARTNIESLSLMTKQILSEGIDDIIAIGIGGSYLGPAMVIESLSPFHQGPEIHFVSNIDPSDLDDTLSILNPVTTAIIAISKTFTTTETCTNLIEAQRWLEAGGVQSTERCYAVTSATNTAIEAGIAPKNILQMDEAIGGRFSLWSAVGLPIMLAQGETAFIDMLAGAESMDRHFAQAEVAKNIPILAALIRIWNTSFLGRVSQGIIPYDNRLAKLPAWLQQLEMESNGKSIDIEGNSVSISTAPIIIGEAGSNAQHSFFQMFHQGREITPVDFLAPLSPITLTPASESSIVRHQHLLAQMLAQADALALGHTMTGDSNFSGGRPSTLITWGETTPYALGRLLAFYEHVTVSAGWLLNLNSFDQPGVELGKKIARAYTSYLESTSKSDIPKNTQAILNQIRAMVKK